MHANTSFSLKLKYIHHLFYLIKKKIRYLTWKKKITFPQSGLQRAKYRYREKQYSERHQN